MVDKFWVATAAHCVDPRFPGSPGPTPKIVIGAHDVFDREGQQNVEVMRRRGQEPSYMNQPHLPCPKASIVVSTSIGC